MSYESDTKADPANLPHLLQLLDDDSPMVQEAVTGELAAFGLSLGQELRRLPLPPDDGQRLAMRRLLASERRGWLRKTWPSWREVQGDKERLEAALTLLADFQNGPASPESLSELLDELAEEFRQWQASRNVHNADGFDELCEEEVLARFLFREKGFEGAHIDYYHPNNSNLMYVIEAKRGMPISLACIYILVGHRLGLSIEGCNWPGHFYARIRARGNLVLVDCYNNGECLEAESFLKMQGPSREAARVVLEEDVPADTIVARVLHNLVRGHHSGAGARGDRDATGVARTAKPPSLSEEDWNDGQLMLNLLKDMHRQQRNSEDAS